MAGARWWVAPALRCVEHHDVFPRSSFPAQFIVCMTRRSGSRHFLQRIAHYERRIRCAASSRVCLTATKTRTDAGCTAGIQGSEDSALNQLGWSQFAVGRRGLKDKDRPASGPVPPYGVESHHTADPKGKSLNTSSPKSIPFVAQMPAGKAKIVAADEQKLCRYEGRDLVAGKRRSYPQHPAAAHVSHIQHVTNSLPEATAKAAPSADEIPYASGGRVRPNSHRYFNEFRSSLKGASVQPSWWG